MVEEKHGSVTISKANPAPARGEADPWAGVFKTRKDAEMKTPEIEMKALKTHLGPTGGQLRSGTPYTLRSEVEATEHVRLGIGERVSPEAPTEEETATASDTEDLEKPWTLAMLPAAYLEKYGDDAKHSAHAKAVLDREKAKA